MVCMVVRNDGSTIVDIYWSNLVDKYAIIVEKRAIVVKKYDGHSMYTVNTTQANNAYKLNG